MPPRSKDARRGPPRLPPKGAGGGAGGGRFPSGGGGGARGGAGGGAPRGGRPRTPSIQWLDELLQEGGIALNPDQLAKLWHYHSLLREGNRDRDLTRIIGFESIVIKHYVDCMYVGKLVQLPSPLLDVGTGAGFPGIPLQIRYPNLRMILAEPRPGRVEFLKKVIGALPLQQIEVFDHRVVSRSFARPVAGVITRAVETIDKTLLRTSACTGVGCQIIFMKGPSVGPELEDAMKRFKGQFRLVMDKSYSLPGTQHDRRLVILEKLIPATVSDEPITDERDEADEADASER